MVHDHPAAFPLAATRHPAAPWLRPPLRNIELVENFLLTLTDAGFDDAAGRSTIDGRTCTVTAICTHLGGVLEWNDADQSYDCPLHGSSVAPTGPHAAERASREPEWATPDRVRG